MEYCHSYARAFCKVENVETFNTYRNVFDKKKINYRTVSNFKNCLLFAGYLIDECNADLISEDERSYYADNRKEFQDKIDFTIDDAFTIEKNIEYLYLTIKKYDSANEKAYTLAVQTANAFLDKLYRKKHRQPDIFGKWCRNGYERAYLHALFHTDESKESFQKFKDLYKQRGIECGDNENYKRCLLYAGALFDCSNVSLLPAWVLDASIDSLEQHRATIYRTSDDDKLIAKTIEFFYIVFKKAQPINEPYYLKAKNDALEFLKKTA